MFNSLNEYISYEIQNIAHIIIYNCLAEYMQPLQLCAIHEDIS